MKSPHLLIIVITSIFAWWDNYLQYVGCSLPGRLLAVSTTLLSASNLCLNIDSPPLYVRLLKNHLGNYMYRTVCLTCSCFLVNVHELRAEAIKPISFSLVYCQSDVDLSILSVRAWTGSESSPLFPCLHIVYVWCMGDVSCCCVHWLHWSSVFTWRHVIWMHLLGRKPKTCR